jgi:hypothetical protein
MAIPSQTAIVNAVLALTGSQEFVTDPLNATGSAQRVLTLWDETVAWMLADHPWNFMIRREPVNATTDIDVTGSRWTHACRLPPECERWLPWAQDDPEYFQGEREGDFLLIDRAPPVTVRFLTSGVDPATWSAHFATAVTKELAAVSVEGIKQKLGLGDRLEARAKTALARAKRIDGLESGLVRRPLPSFRSEWLEARRRPYAHIGR